MFVDKNISYMEKGAALISLRKEEFSL